jgi:class 3 adenylate cyclase/pSer/pThr/pTyr-binding forkhead associated (FHA) protein
VYSLTITNPNSESLQIKLTSGKMVLGRAVDCDIVINDASASRRHAEIFYDSMTELVTINDLKSSNGTYVNRQRITRMSRLQSGDVIRIGQTVIYLTKITEAATGQKGITGTHLFTRELVLEAVDEHPIPLNEITEELNTVVDIDSAISLVMDLIKRSLGVDVCEIVLARDFGKIAMEDPENLMVRAIRNSSVEASPLALSVPVISGGKPFALIYLERNRQEARPFDKREMQLVVGISHQTALALQRIELLERIHREQEVKQLLLRFISPIEADEVLKDYLKTGNLPDLAEKKATVLFVEIADSTGLAERIGPAAFSLFLNDFYQYATQVVFKNGGMVKYLGDGLMAVFMEVSDKQDPEVRAAMVARDIIDYVKRADQPEPDRPWVVGVAINTGNAIVGYLGTRERAEFNVMGNLIKMTYRMQEYALPNRIFVGASTAEAIRNKYIIQKVGNMAMKGSEQPVQVFEVSFIKTAPFVHTDKDGEMSAAFKAINQRIKSLKK